MNSRCRWSRWGKGSAALRAVAEKLGIGSAETLRNWVRWDQVDSGQRPGATTEESTQIKAMKKGIAELDRPHQRS
ncbi:hypothetical protein AB0O31_07935 [Kitasatospora cineracea]|uniref:hypothetical protein n=1 Tax=Kitasatospora cineracea TaxID=88074 RepID=UPI0034316135